MTGHKNFIQLLYNHTIVYYYLLLTSSGRVLMKDGLIDATPNQGASNPTKLAINVYNNRNIKYKLYSM